MLRQKYKRFMYRKLQITNFMKLLLDTASILKKLKTFALTRETIALQMEKQCFKSYGNDPLI